MADMLFERAPASADFRHRCLLKARSVRQCRGGRKRTGEELAARDTEPLCGVIHTLECLVGERDRGLYIYEITQSYREWTRRKDIRVVTGKDPDAGVSHVV